MTIDKYDLGDVEALQGVAKFPARIKCATLAWKAMEKGVKERSSKLELFLNERRRQQMAKKMPDIGDYKYGFHDKDVSIFRSERGLTEEIVREISNMKEEPQWMLRLPLKSLEISIKHQCHNGVATFLH